MTFNSETNLHSLGSGGNSYLNDSASVGFLQITNQEWTMWHGNGYEPDQKGLGTFNSYMHKGSLIVSIQENVCKFKSS